jgi:hypothetical protein
MIDDDTDINDIRKQSEFKTMTFSGYKKTDVKKALFNSIMNNKIEESLYWSVELICSGIFLDLWEIIIYYYSKHIQIANIKMAIYLDLRIEDFKNIMQNGFTGYEINMRNNNRIRLLFCEIIIVLCQSKRQHSFDEIKITKSDFDLTQMTDRFKAPNINFSENIIKDDDPKEIIIATNELNYNIHIKNGITTCYWIEWLIELNSIKFYNKTKKLKCERRLLLKHNNDNQHNIIWIVWESIIFQSDKSSEIIKRVIKSLLNLFCFHYSNTSNKKHKFLIYFAIYLLTENIYITQDTIVENKEKVELIKKQINNIYKQVKKNEQSPNTDYLFKNIKNNNLDKSIQKLEKLNTFSQSFIPRSNDDNDDDNKI